MAKIEKLSPQQQKQLAAFRATWLAHGISTARADRAKAEAAIMAMRAEIGTTTKPIFIWCASPATSLLAIQFIKSPSWANYLKTVDQQMSKAGLKNNQSRASLRASLWASLGDSLGASLRASLWASLGDSLGASLGASLRASLGASLRASLGDIKNFKPAEELAIAWWGQYDSYWVAFYLFARDILEVKYDAKRSRQLDLWRDLAQSCGWWWCYENYVIISERPITCGLNAQERIHCENGPALAFSDGWQVYALNGVRMTRDHVMTPAEKLDPVACLKETNVEIRRELIRKIGVEMLLAHLPHRVLDTQGNYSVLAIDFPGLVQDARYLKMLNPSIGVWHLEGVERECNTVQQAINWRAGKFGVARDWKPAQLT